MLLCAAVFCLTLHTPSVPFSSYLVSQRPTCWESISELPCPLANGSAWTTGILVGRKSGVRGQNVYFSGSLLVLLHTLNPQVKTWFLSRSLPCIPYFECDISSTHLSILAFFVGFFFSSPSICDSHYFYWNLFLSNYALSFALGKSWNYKRKGTKSLELLFENKVTH